MRKKLTLLACLACLALTSAQALGQNEAPVIPKRQAELSAWKTYHVEDEPISASFPTQPAVTTNQRYRELLRQTLTDRMVGAYADGVVYSLYIYDNPAPRDSFDIFMSRQLESGGWDVSTERPISLGRYGGKQYSATNKSLPATVQFFAVEDELYKLTAVGAPLEDPGVKHFFSSIQLGKKGTEISDGPGRPFLNPPGDGPADVLTGRQVDTKVRLVMKPEPSYTEAAREERIVGTVVLKVVFSSSGAVTNIRTVQGLPHGLTEVAVVAAKSIKFIPAMKEGKYVSMWMQLEYNFNLY